MHLSDGEIRAFIDQQLEAEQRQDAQRHLEACPRCREKLQALLAQAQRVEGRLSLTQRDPSVAQTSTRAGRLRLAARLSTIEKENESMWKQLTSRIPRPAWVALGVVLVLSISMAFAPVRAIANSFLGLFRVEQIRVVQFDPENLAHESGTSSNLEVMFSENVQFNKRGEPQEVASAAEASALAGIAVRLPGEMEGKPKLIVQPGGNATFNVDMELVSAVLKDLGRSDIELPEALDGASVTVEVPPSVVAEFGGCDYSEGLPHSDPDDPSQSGPTLRCTTLVQMPSPTISAPPGTDLSQIGEAYLQLLGMTREEAESFARNVDWTTTFVIPIPRNGTEYRDVQVDGVTGTLIERWGEEYVLLWVKEGIVYALSGPGDAKTALAVAGSLQ